MLVDAFSPQTIISPRRRNVDEAPSGLPEPLAKDFRNLTHSQKELVVALWSSEGDRINQLFESWTSAENEGTAPASKRRLITQLEMIDKNLVSGGGLVGYINDARRLQEESRISVDRLKGWKAMNPTGEMFELGSDDFKDVETLGKRELDCVGFVVVAGFETKIDLPIDSTTGTTFLQLYIESVLSIQRKYGHSDVRLPLCIMTSSDTNQRITALLQGNKYFGMTEDQVTILVQGSVPTLRQKDTTLLLHPYNEFTIRTETHGHGDIHGLLHKHKVPERWREYGVKWIVFLQDANGLAFHNLALMLGMSVKHTLTMNMLAYPRKVNEAVESIVKLVNEETSETRTISLDYDQLDPLLSRSGFTYGDEDSQSSAFSPFPGSTNQFIFNLDRYVDNLEKSAGIMPEFVVKHEDCPEHCHLECRMQDISTILSGRDAFKIGFTCVPTTSCFSPVIVQAEEASTLQRKGMMPKCMASGEADQYASHCNTLRAIGCKVDEATPKIYHGVTVTLGPHIIIKPDAACFPSEVADIFPNPEQISISARSSLIISGPNVVIESLSLDGALVIKGKEGVDEQVVENRVVKNLGWTVVVEEDSADEVVAMRGYRFVKEETETIAFRETLMDVVVRRFNCGTQPS